jgi:hypothetical protein
MQLVQLNSQYYGPNTSPSAETHHRPQDPRGGTEEGETAMKTMTVMIEWSAIAVALYATLALALPVEAFAGLV